MPGREDSVGFFVYMGMKSERTQFREYTSWPSLAYAAFLGAAVLSCYAILAGSDLPNVLRVPVVLLILFLEGLVIAVLGGLTVLVQESRIVLHLGRLPLIRRVVAFSDIVSLRSVEYRPLAEFGGWGARGFGKRRAWTASGNRAVAVRLSGDRELLIGSNHPKRLEERIRTLGEVARDAEG